MDRGNTNIDVVFRNGLKDYEAIPDHDVWRIISPSVKRKKPLLLPLQIAASMIVVLSLSYLAYRQGVNVGSDISNQNVPMLVDASIQPNVETSRVVVSGEDMYIDRNDIRPSQADILINAREAGLFAADNYDRNIVLTSVNSVDVAAPSVVSNYQTGIAEQTDGTLVIGPYSFKELDRQDYEMEMALVDEVNAKQYNRWSIAALASPTYYSGAATSSVVASNSEQQATSFSGGVTFAYNVNKRLSVQSGVYYASIGQRVNGVNAFAGFSPFNDSKGSSTFEVETSKGSIQANNDDVFLYDALGNRVSSSFEAGNFDPIKSNLSNVGNSLRQNFSYVEIPVSLRYKVIDKTFDLNIIGGVSSNILVGNNVYANSDLGKFDIGQTAGVNDFILSSTVGMGMEYNISNKISLNLEPMVRYYLTPVSASVSNINSLSFGLFSGLSYKF